MTSSFAKLFHISVSSEMQKQKEVIRRIADEEIDDDYDDDDIDDYPSLQKEKKGSSSDLSKVPLSKHISFRFPSSYHHVSDFLESGLTVNSFIFDTEEKGIRSKSKQPHRYFD